MGLRLEVAKLKEELLRFQRSFKLVLQKVAFPFMALKFKELKSHIQDQEKQISLLVALVFTKWLISREED